MVRSIENIKASNLCLLTNIEDFLLLDMVSHNIDYDAKQRFRKQLHCAIFILDGINEDCRENGRQYLWDGGRDLIDSENIMEIIGNLFTKHVAMYARVSYSFLPSIPAAISCIDSFLNSYKQNSSSGSSSSNSSTSNSSSSNSADL